MDVKEAIAALAICYAADELGTRAMLKAGGRETMISKPGIRIALKIPVGALFVKKRKSKALAVLVPAAYCGAGAWNFSVAEEMKRRQGR